MRTVAAISIILLIGITKLAPPEGRSYITSRYNGIIYESCITDEQCDKMPAWHPLTGRPIPVSPGRAIRLAQSVLEKHVPKRERSNWILKRVQLMHFHDALSPKAYAEEGEQKWYYVVHLWNKTNPEVAESPTPRAIRAKQEEFNIFVLMSGKACEPIPREREKRDSEPAHAADGSR